MFNIKTCTILSSLITIVGITGCEKKPPDNRPPVDIAIYTLGDPIQGQQQYNKDCGNCHKLQPGNNQKAPQLLRIYGAKSALLTDYTYSEALKNANLTWSADTLDSYIADPKKIVNGTKMKSNPITDSNERRNIIAYLSTLR